MNTYTDPRLLDVAGAVESLPNLPLSGGPQEGRNVVSATGTDDLPASQFAPGFAPTPVKSSKSGSIPDKTALAGDSPKDAWALAVSAYPVNENGPLTTAVSGPILVEQRRVELPTSALRM